MSHESAATLQMLEEIPDMGTIHIERRHAGPIALCGGEETVVPEDEITDASLCGTCEVEDIELRKQGL